MTLSRRLISVTLVTVLAVSSGCTWFAPKPPKEAADMLQTGLTNLLAQKSGDYTMRINGNLLGKDAENKPQNMVFDLSGTGDSLKKDMVATDFNTKLAMSLKINQDAYAANAELRGNEKSIFAILTSLTGPEKDIPKDQISGFLNTWWKIPLPENFYKDLVANKDMSSYLVKVQQIYQAALDYLKDVSYEGVDTIGGLKSYHYSAEVDMAKLKAFLEGYLKSNGSSMTAEDIKEYNELINNAKADADFWVSMDGQILNRIKFDVKLNKILASDGASAGKGELHFDTTGSNFGKTVTVQEPTPVQEFDLFGLLGGLGIDPTGGAMLPADATKVPDTKEPVKK